MLDIVSGWFSDWAERSSMGSSPKIRFALDSPLEGDGFELLVPRHESPRFPKHPGMIVAPTV